MSRLLVWAAAVLMASSVLAGQDGAQLYAHNCAACHGEDGSGGVGVPLSLPAFLAAAPDRYLETTIRLGRPGRVMPAFPGLSDEQVEAIVSHIRGWHPDRPADDRTVVHGDAKRGSELYAEHCAACHGAQGEGGKGTGVTFSRPRELPIIAPALNNTGFLASASDQMIKQTLMKGRPGTPMPSFLDQDLSERDINDLVAHVRSFQGADRHRSEIGGLEPILVYESPYSLEETVENVKRAATGKNFRIIREQGLDYGLVTEGEEDRQRTIVYFCNFKFLADVLAIDPRVGLFLPCRVTVVEQEGVVQVMTINPRRLSHLFNNHDLDEACEQMYRLYEEILEEATL